MCGRLAVVGLSFDQTIKRLNETFHNKTSLILKSSWQVGNNNNQSQYYAILVDYERFKKVAKYIRSSIASLVLSPT